jgi:glycosyltransferase involved in cell wall biosynthesis
MTAAIYYHPEAYTTSGPKLMGRNAAGESFLRGYFQNSRASKFWVLPDLPEHASSFEVMKRQCGRTEPVELVERTKIDALKAPGALYYPGPDIGHQAWVRASYGHGSWSLCGITHTTSSARAMDGLADLLTAPIQPWDALICTSEAVKNNVTKLLQAQADFLVQRLGIQRLVLPEMPVIPLGINTKDFVFTANQREQARSAIDAGRQTLVVLYMGRLSFHAKAHPLAMYQSLEKAARKLPVGCKITLVECGWYANDFIENAYREASSQACPSVSIVKLDGRKSKDRQTAWASADVFCSLSDNIQETFGIVPIEAMAAGLPVVVSDWDGYKDTVRNGIDGFRVSTTMPANEFGGDLALRHAFGIDSYDMYCGNSSNLVAVDVEATEQAFTKLFESPEMRAQMGLTGQRRARECYDWSVIIPRYESLWERLCDIRLSKSAVLQPLKHPWPARMEPFHAFSAYAAINATDCSVAG